jgi:class 3 adenylate cyclase
MAWGPPIAALLVVSVMLGWLAVGTLAITQTLVLPIVDLGLAAFLSLIATIAFRLVVADRDKRLLRHSFAFYLSPPLIERMLSSSKLPSLGGETRIVTLSHSDLAGFSALSEKLSAAEVVSLINDYLSAMTEIIDAHGGFVEKYVGDAIDGVFGAPVDDPDHALNAVRAALACKAKLREMNDAALDTFKGYELRQRIGIHSGSALVGNIGSRQRFNYAAMGDAANLPSRLEGANKFYGTEIIASEATVHLVGDSIAWRELDVIRVVGRQGTMRVFEPLAEAGSETAAQISCAAAYAEGLMHWRSGNFAEAVEAFERFGDWDIPSRLFRERALRLLHAPPGPGWCPVNALDSK